jgi:hypothetical protein
MRAATAARSSGTDIRTKDEILEENSKIRSSLEMEGEAAWELTFAGDATSPEGRGSGVRLISSNAFFEAFLRCLRVLELVKEEAERERFRFSFFRRFFAEGEASLSF